MSGYMSLQFFGHINRFTKSRPTNKNKSTINEEEVLSHVGMDHRESHDHDRHEAGGLQRSVKKLLFGNWEEKETAATEIERLAREDDKTKKAMAELGVIPALVGIVSTEAEVAAGRHQVAIKALIELANGSLTNKALMVEAGILLKLPRRVEILEESTIRDFTELVLSLSSLANTRFPLTSCHEMLTFLVGILQSDSSLETKESCIGTLYSLSTMLENAGLLVSSGVVPILLRLISVKKVSEKALATLGHLVVTLMGKKAIESSSLVPESLIEILTWEDNPKCQELSAYVLMILAHQSSAQRDKMVKSGIVPVLLEVVLLGTPLAQKRASKLLQWFKDERQMKMGPHSGPQTGRVVMGSPVNNHKEAQEGNRMMRSLVKQSLYKNLEIITQRANSPVHESSNLKKALVISTSSKSLP